MSKNVYFSKLKEQKLFGRAVSLKVNNNNKKKKKEEEKKENIWGKRKWGKDESTWRLLKRLPIGLK